MSYVCADGIEDKDTLWVSLIMGLPVDCILIGGCTFAFVRGDTAAYPSVPELSVAPVIPLLYVAAANTTDAVIKDKEMVLALWALAIPFGMAILGLMIALGNEAVSHAWT
ncbi:hypothetical protein E8E11_000116 [Didymella keratinophila]|nr:hypothetical protein E8E11_000116 [Didymella keratinophila]